MCFLIVHFIETSMNIITLNINIIRAIIILCRKIAISPEPNLRWTSDQSVNSRLSVAVQEKKSRALYLSRLKLGGPMKFENTLFQIAKLRLSSIFVIFDKFPKFSQNSQGTSLKARDLKFWILALYTVSF